MLLTDVHDGHTEAPFSTFGSYPHPALKEKGILLFICWILISASSPLKASPFSAILCCSYHHRGWEWGWGCCTVGGQGCRWRVEKSSQCSLWKDASLPVDKPRGWSPPGCPVAFVCVQLSAPVHQAERAHSGAFMRLWDPGRLDTISWEGRCEPCTWECAHSACLQLFGGAQGPGVSPEEWHWTATWGSFIPCTWSLWKGGVGIPCSELGMSKFRAARANLWSWPSAFISVYTSWSPCLRVETLSSLSLWSHIPEALSKPLLKEWTELLLLSCSSRHTDVLYYPSSRPQNILPLGVWSTYWKDWNHLLVQRE